ncbi:hypothetical protein [Shewanella surugensis]|uniref:Uncharacterized protein n=1 Tax=Shewanella surugensis TaxID=212020 RepID=A0ABT0LAW2_9GAMM|nr:hypothetical protein [Shewanella surugensis]MCL1124814.1 hypothetical protein [Shewanella surugensis]
MGPQKILEYQKSIKFEFIRAQMAFTEFFDFAKTKYSQLTVSGNTNGIDTITKLKYFDAYARWCGHVYEVIKAQAIIDQTIPVDENSQVSIIDKELQKVVEELVSSAVEKPGVTPPSLNPDFSADLRKARNKCSFHCTNNRVKTNILLNFMKNHHREIYFIYYQLATKPELLGVQNLTDFGAIEDFYCFNYSVGKN